MMKSKLLRVTAVVLSLLSLLLLLVSCGGGNTPSAEPKYVFKADGLTLWIGQPAEGVVGDLPTVSTVLTSTSCGIPGTDYAYPCRGYRVSTTPGSAGDQDHYVKLIELTDDTWNKFVADVNNMGADELLGAYQTAVERIYAGGAF